MATTLASFKQKISSDRLLQTPYYKISFVGQIGGRDGDSTNNPASLAAGSDFDIYCQSLDIPGKKLSVLEVKRHGFTLRMPNIVEFDGTFKASVLVNLNLTAYEGLMNWQKEYSDIKIGAGGVRGFPNTQAKVELLDNKFAKAGKTLMIYGVFPSEVPSLSMKQDASEYITADCTFTYSYCGDWNDSNDPLTGAKKDS